MKSFYVPGKQPVVATIRNGLLKQKEQRQTRFLSKNHVVGGFITEMEGKHC